MLRPHCTLQTCRILILCLLLIVSRHWQEQFRRHKIMLKATAAGCRKASELSKLWPCGSTEAVQFDVKSSGLQRASWGSLSIGHATHACHKGRKGAHDGHKARQDHRLAAVLPVEVLRLPYEVLQRAENGGISAICEIYPLYHQTIANATDGRTLGSSPGGQVPFLWP